MWLRLTKWKRKGILQLKNSYNIYREYDKQVISLHKPHPGDEMKAGAVKGLLERLCEIGDL